MSTAIPRRATAAVTAVALGTLLSLAATGPAQAHDSLIDSAPGAGDVVTSLPPEFSITMNEPLQDLTGTAAGFAIQVTDADGAFYGDGCLTIAGATLSTPAELGPAGTYRMVWQVVSQDGHTASGELTFEWEPPTGFEPATPQAEPPVCGVEAPVVTPTPTTTPGSSSTPSATPVASSAQEDQNPDVALWVAGGLLAVLVLGAAVLIVRSRRSRPSA